MTELPKTSKTELDLIEIIESNPTISISHDLGDIFWITEQRYQEERDMCVSVKPEDGYDENIPFISHNIPNTDIYFYIKFFPENLSIKKERVSRDIEDPKENIDLPLEGKDEQYAYELIYAAKKGLEMMQKLKAIPEEERREISTYYNFVDDSRYREHPFFDRNALEGCLEGINKVVGD